MDFNISFLNDYLYTFFLIFCRIGCGIMLITTLGDTLVNTKTKLIFSLGISYILLPILSPLLPKFSNNIHDLCYYILHECLIGLFFGTLIKILFSSLQIAGNIISMQSSFSAATFFDPNFGGQNPIISNFLFYFLLINIYVSDLHHVFLKALIETFYKFPPQEMLNFSDWSTGIIRVIDDSFDLSFKISAPFVLAGITVNVGAAILSRLMPTFQVFFVLMPVNILILFIIISLSLNVIINFVMDNFYHLMEQFL